jgi:hypothetical protein
MTISARRNEGLQVETAMVGRAANIALLIPILGLQSCVTRSNEPTLRSLFEAHQGQLWRLVVMIREDHRLQAVTRDGVAVKLPDDDFVMRGPSELQGLRWQEYQKLFDAVGLPAGVGQYESAVYFRAVEPSVGNGDTEQGLVYSEAPLPECSTEIARCIPPRAQRHSGLVLYHQIAPHWYAYLRYG